MKWLPSNANQSARRLTDPYHVIPNQKLVFSAYLAFIVRLELQNQSLFKDESSGLFSGQFCAHVFTLSIVPASSGEEGSMVTSYWVCATKFCGQFKTPSKMWVPCIVPFLCLKNPFSPLSVLRKVRRHTSNSLENVAQLWSIQLLNGEPTQQHILFLGSSPYPAGKMFEFKSFQMTKQPHSRSDFLCHQHVGHFSDLIQFECQKKALINNNYAFRMTGISLDVVGRNIVVYASTGITPLFRVLTRSLRVVLLQFFVFLSICQARSFFCTFPVKSVRQQFRWWFEMRALYLHMHVFKEELNCCRLFWGQLKTGQSQTCKHASIILRDFGHERHVRYATEGPYIFTCNDIVECCVRRQKLKFRFIPVCFASSGTMRFY